MHRNIRLYYWYLFLASIFFSAPIFFLFEQSAGLSFFELALLESIFAITIVILEVPSGAFADKHGRKNSLIIASVLGFASYLFFGFGFSFGAFLIAQIIGGIAAAFASGATDALLYDTLLNEKQASLFPQKAGRGMVFAWAGLGISGLVGGWLANFDLALPMKLTLIPLALTTVAVFFFKEPKRKKAESVARIQTESWHFINKNKTLKHLIIYMWLVFAIPVSAVMIFYQSHILVLGLPLSLFGIVFLMRTGAGGMGSYLAEWFSKRVKIFTFLSITLLVLSFLMIILAAGNLFWFLLALFWFEFVAGVVIVLLPNEINKHTPSDKRATVLSFGSLGQQIVLATLLPLAGLFGTRLGFAQVSTIAAVLLLIFFVVFIRWRKDFDKI